MTKEFALPRLRLLRQYARSPQRDFSERLHFHRLDGGLQEEGTDETLVEARPNGPLFLRGRIRIEDADGNPIREDTRVALCRCGGSANKPFCDGTHKKNGFRS